MFDSAPSNLPVEPASQAPKPAAPPTPAMPNPMAPPMMVSGVKKEPEDIFSNLDQGRGGNAGAMQSDEAMLDEAPKQGMGKAIALVAGGLVVLGLLGGGFYYFFVVRPSAEPAAVVEAPKTDPTPEFVEQPPVVLQEQSAQPVSQVPITEPPAGTNIPLPQAVQPDATPITASTTETVPTAPVTSSTPATSISPPAKDGADQDGDEFTDVEEAAYRTDPAKFDTDGDGFSDGSEVRNLFNPLVKAQPLSESKAIETGEWHGLSFLIPKAWRLVPDSSSQNLAQIDTRTSARFLLRREDNPGKQTVQEWVKARVGGDSWRVFRSKNGLDVAQTPDGRTSYIVINDMVLIVTYELGAAETVEFKTSLSMFLHSLQRPLRR